MDICAEDHSRALEAGHEPQTGGAIAGESGSVAAVALLCGEAAAAAVYWARSPDESAPLGAYARRARTMMPRVRAAEKLWRACCPWPLLCGTSALRPPPHLGGGATPSAVALSRGRLLHRMPDTTCPVQGMATDQTKQRAVSQVLGSGGEST